MTKHVGPRGSLLTKRHAKDPVRVAAGVTSRKNRDPQGQLRSSHLGYDCYITGHVNGVGRTRIIMRRGRLPPHLPADMISILPVEMWWPQRDHRACHELINAVLTCDLGALAGWKSSWPDHAFGFEEFLELAERRTTGIRNAAVESKALEPTKRLDGAAERAPLTCLFPGVPESVERHGGRDLERFNIRTWIVRFNDGQAAMRVDINGLVEGPDDVERVTCSRAYVDLLDGRFEIIEHFPGRLRALGLPVDLLHQVLGVRAPSSANHRQHSFRHQMRRGAPRPLTPREAANRVVDRAATAQTILLTGDPDAEVVKEPAPKVEPIPVAGNARYERKLARDEIEEEFEHFPDAPGQVPAVRRR